MSEIVQKVLDEFKNTLEANDGITSELIASLDAELIKSSPNPETLAQAIKKPKVGKA